MTMTTRFCFYRLLNCAVATLVALLAASPLHAIEEVKRKGRFLKKEIVRFDDKTSYNVTLTITENSSCPMFKFTHITQRTIHEIKVFETVVDTINTSAQDAQNIKDYRALKILPDEYIKDDPTTREITIVEGPFALTPFSINGQQIITDSKGCYEDSKQALLQQFDNLAINAFEVNVEHETYGQKTLQLTRLIIRQPDKITPDYKHDDPNATLDILQGMGLDFTRAPNLGRAKLNVQCSLPESYTPGNSFNITLTVKNMSDVTAGNLFFCSFSREEWLDGKLFYIGNLNGGETRSFTRVVTPPDNSPTDSSYFLIASWDAIRALPNEAQTFSIRKKK